WVPGWNSAISRSSPACAAACASFSRTWKRAWRCSTTISSTRWCCRARCSPCTTPSVSCAKWRGLRSTASYRSPTSVTGRTAGRFCVVACRSRAKCHISGTTHPTFTCAPCAISKTWLLRWVCALPTWQRSRATTRLKSCLAGAARWPCTALNRVAERGSPSTASTSKRVYTSPRVLPLLVLGFASGLPLALTGGTLQAWATLDGVSLQSIGFLTLIGSAYTLKFLWAPLVDRYSFPFLGRRRSWILLTQLALAASIAAMGLYSPGSSMLPLAMLAVLVAFLSATQDIAFDAYSTDVLRSEERAAGAAIKV